MGEGSFWGCQKLNRFNVPSSVETTGDRCFEDCRNLTRIGFDGLSRLKEIGRYCFRNCPLACIAIPASVEELDGSAFGERQVCGVQIGAGSRNFRSNRNAIATPDGTELVRYFGMQPEISVPRVYVALRNSCYECRLQRILCQSESKLKIIAKLRVRWL
jgi:hypothetical protein